MSEQLRRVTPADWPDLRALRLEALADSPVAFCVRLVEAEAAPDAEWQRKAARGADGGDSVQLMAWRDGHAVATAGGFLRGRDAVLFGVYVSPPSRGQGLLGRLVEGVVAWSQAQGAERLLLLVHESNERAASAYTRLGFTLTGYREPYPLEPSTDELEMARPLP